MEMTVEATIAVLAAALYLAGGLHASILIGRISGLLAVETRHLLTRLDVELRKAWRALSGRSSRRKSRRRPRRGSTSRGQSTEARTRGRGRR